MIQTKAEFLELLEKLFPEYMWDEMPSYIIEAYASLGEKLADSIEEFKNSKLPSESGYGDYATGKLKIYRGDATNAWSVSAGFLMQYRSTFILVTDPISLNVGEYITPELNWISIKKGTQHNLFENCLVQNVSIVADYFYGIVTEVNNDGLNPDLYYQGTLHNITPAKNETEHAFRKRIRNLPAKITKSAILAIVQKYFPTGYITEGFENAGYALSELNVVLVDNEEFLFLDDETYGLLGSDIFQAYFEIHIPFSNYTVDEMPILYLAATDTGDGGHIAYNDTDNWYDGYLCYDLNHVVKNKSTELSLMCAELKESVAAGVSYDIFEDIIS